MSRHGIPTAKWKANNPGNVDLYQKFSNCDEALAHIDEIDYEVVIKASGLAAGKGVIIPSTPEEAKKAVRDMMQNKIFGEAGMLQYDMP